MSSSNSSNSSSAKNIGSTALKLAITAATIFVLFWAASKGWQSGKKQ